MRAYYKVIRRNMWQRKHLALSFGKHKQRQRLIEARLQLYSTLSETPYLPPKHNVRVLLAQISRENGKNIVTNKPQTIQKIRKTKKKKHEKVEKYNGNNFSMVRVSGVDNDCFYRACSLFSNEEMSRQYNGDPSVANERLDDEAKSLRNEMRDFAIEHAQDFTLLIKKHEDIWSNFLRTTGCNNLAEAAERIVAPNAAADLFEIYVFANMMNVNVNIYNNVGRGRITFYQRVEPFFLTLDKSERTDIYLHYYMDSGNDTDSHYNLLVLK